MLRAFGRPHNTQYLAVALDRGNVNEAEGRDDASMKPSKVCVNEAEGRDIGNGIRGTRNSRDTIPNSSEARHFSCAVYAEKPRLRGSATRVAQPRRVFGEDVHWTTQIPDLDA
jgi:hypothetical protein